MSSIIWDRDVADVYDQTYRAKPGAEAVPVTIGDMTTTRCPGRRSRWSTWWRTRS